MTPSIHAPTSGAPEPLEGTPRAHPPVAEAIYAWDLTTDALTWGSNAEAIFGSFAATWTTGRQFAARLVSESICSREKAILGGSCDLGHGVAYDASYGVICDDEDRDAAIVWLEDRGRWFAGADGRAARAEGRVRVITLRLDADRQSAAGEDAFATLIGRAPFLEHVERKLAAMGRKPAPFSLLVGRHRGDASARALVGVVETLRLQMRTRDVLARLTPNDIGLLLEACDPEQMRTAADRLLDALGTPYTDTFVFGGAVAPHDGRSADVLLAHAETALADGIERTVPFVAYNPALG